MLDQTTSRPLHAAQSGSNAAPVLSVRRLNLWYDDTHALKNVDFDLYPNEILAFIGPSGCGKSTALKCLNRMHDDTRGVRIEGQIAMDGQDIYAPEIDPPMHRRRFGWVAQKPNPFAKTIFENVAYGPRIHGLVAGRAALERRVEEALRQARLWDEVKDSLHKTSGHALSGGQQQRLCIARALACEAEVLLMDEPTGSIDPIATAEVEDLLVRLKSQLSVVIITHSMMQARRVADRVGYFHLGVLRELAPTEAMFQAAQDPDARAFIAGKFG